MTFFSVETCRKKRAHEIGGETRAYHLRAEADDIHVVVLDSLVRGVHVVADRCPDPGDRARGDRGADTGAADEHATLGLSVLDRRAELGSFHRVVDPHCVVVGAEVDDLVSVVAQRLEDRVPEMDASVVERHGNFHATDRT